MNSLPGPAIYLYGVLVKYGIHLGPLTGQVVKIGHLLTSLDEVAAKCRLHISYLKQAHGIRRMVKFDYEE